MSFRELANKWGVLLHEALSFSQGKGATKESLTEAFNDYCAGYDQKYGFGGQPGSTFNREVLAKRVVQELGHFVGRQHRLDIQQSRLLEADLMLIARAPEVQRLLEGLNEFMEQEEDNTAERRGIHR